MSLRLLVRPEAESDIREIVRWYEDRHIGLGWQFVEDVGESIGRALRNPKAYRLMRREPHVRRILTRRFPYRIFYLLREDALVVFAVIHGKREETNWSGRV
jgi:plasmid stabilization system protein ParE